MPDQVSRYAGIQPNSEMGAIGYLIGALLGVMLLPVLPFLALLWLFRNVSGSGRDRRGPTSG